MNILSQDLSIGVLKEIESLKKFKAYDINLNLLSFNEIIENWGFNLNNYNNLDLFSKKLKILDIGVGKGQSSLYLASHGHEVWCVEPYIEYCYQIEMISKKFNFNIIVCNGTAEAIDKIKNKFDVVIFNASLHHCDDPNLALRLSYDCLKDGGLIRLYSETFLRPWNTKKGFKKKLEMDPIGMGHYGGNEHAYHNWEYIIMLKNAGFIDVELDKPKDGTVLDKIEYRLKRRIGNKRIDNNSLVIILRIIYYMIQDLLSNFSLLRQCSIFSTNFKARKQDNDKKSIN